MGRLVADGAEGIPSFMDQAHAVTISLQPDPITSPRARVQAEGRTHELEVERALERGLAWLLRLEAQLRRAGTSDTRTGAQLRPSDVAVEIASLRSTLAELRVTDSPHRPRRAAFGFVLPCNRRG